jgi:thiol-disulfide isomerase/thioredoxin
MAGEDGRKSSGDDVKTFYFGFLALGLIIGVIMGIAVGGSLLSQNPAQTCLPRAANVLTPEEAGEKVIDFVANYAVPPSVEVTLINVTEVENANLYKVAINLSTLDTSETQEVFITKDGESLFLRAIDIEEFIALAETQKEQEEERAQEQQQEPTIGNFIVSSDAPCNENGKPVIYFFGSEGCAYCKWEHPIIENVTSEFEGYISFHDNMNNSGADREVFGRYSTGGIPTIVLGCSYYRVGAGVTIGEDQEEKVLTALICKLTDNKPEEVCKNPEIEALVNQIE